MALGDLTDILGDLKGPGSLKESPGRFERVPKLPKSGNLKGPWWSRGKLVV